MLLIVLILWTVAIFINIQMAKAYGYNTVLCVIMGIFFTVISTLFIWLLGMSKTGIANPFTYNAGQTLSNGGTPHESRLKRLKGLLDDGTITQAEFDAKKKQLLGV